MNNDTTETAVSPVMGRMKPKVIALRFKEAEPYDQATLQTLEEIVVCLQYKDLKRSLPNKARYILDMALGVRPCTLPFTEYLLDVLQTQGERFHPTDKKRPCTSEAMEKQTTKQGLYLVK